MIRNWGYGETQNSASGRIDVRYVGRMHRSQFIKTVLRGDTFGTQWLKDRTSDTGNSFELELIAKYPNRVVKYGDAIRGERNVLEILDKIVESKEL